MGYFQIYLYTPYVYDWEKSYEIVISFLNQRGVKGFSYNTYFGGSELLSHITVRFNFEKDEEGKQNIERVIGNLIDKKLVIAKGEWTQFATSPSVARATEVSTKCALAFTDWMNKHIEILKNYLSDSQYRIEFVSRFLVILLQQLAFKTWFEDYPLDDNLVEMIRECAEYCGNQIKEDFNPPLDITFMERIIHHFLNCIHVDTGREEPIIYGKIAHWEWLGSLLEKRTT